MNCQELTKSISNIKAHITEFDKFVIGRKPEEAIKIKDNINKILYSCLLAQLDKGEREKRLRERFDTKGYTNVGNFYFERAIAQQKINRRFYIIDVTGNKIGNFARDGFEMAHHFRDNRAWVVKENKVFYVDSDGNQIGNFADNDFEAADDFSDNRARVYKDGICFFIDPDGNQIGNFAKAGFKIAGQFFENRAKVKKEGKWYYIDPDGNKIGNDANDGFVNAEDFSENRAWVGFTNGKNRYIDLDGNYIDDTQL